MSMANISNLTTDQVAALLADFMNGVQAGDTKIYEQTVQAMKSAYDLDAAQETAVRVALTHLELMAQHATPDFDLKGFVGLECNVIFWIIAGDYDILNRRILSGDFDPSAS